MNISLKQKSFFYTIILYIFALQRALIDFFSLFTYIDEILSIISAMYIVSYINKNKKIPKKLFIILLLWIITIYIGLYSNYKSNLLDDIYLILIDIISTVKVWLSYIFVFFLIKEERCCDNIIKTAASFTRILIYIMFFFLLLSQFIDLGMTAYPRYGFPSFHFIFNNPGNFSKYFYFSIPLLTADLYYEDNLYKRFTLVLSLIVWVSTMRSRSFAFVLIFIPLFIFYLNKKNKSRGEIKFKYLIGLGLITLLVCWKQFIFYFTTDTQARSMLLRYGLKTMKNYFPFGSGFGTFGSNVAATSYSKLYYLYGFDNRWGMKPGQAYFLDDNYWPMIVGQFGLIGTVLVVFILIIFMLDVVNNVKKNKYFYIASVSALGFLFLSSIASKSYSEFSSICIFMLLAILVKKEKIKDEK